MLLGQPTIRDERDAARAFESLLLRQLLQASGAFRQQGGGAGAGIHADLFVDALADALAQAGGLGLAGELGVPGGAGPASLAPRSAEAGGLLAGPARVTSTFGLRADPFHGGTAVHRGVDFAAPEGTEIRAAEGGVVRRAGDRGAYGQAVEIDHGGGVTTLYAHASELLVAEGETVRRGQAIGRVGDTGRATGAHLHFEVREGGRAVDPARALKAYGLRADRPIERGEE